MKGNFDLRKLASLPTIFFPVLSHDEKKLAFYYDITGRMEIHILDLETRELTQATHGELPQLISSGFIWARNNEELIFCKDKDGNEQHDIYAIHITTGELRQLTDTPDAQEYVVDTSPDGEWISVNSNRNGQMNIFKMRTDGSEMKQLTATDNPSTGGRFSPDGKYLAFNTNEEANLKNKDIYLMDLENGEVEMIVSTSVGAEDMFMQYSHDGKFFCFTTDTRGANQGGIYNLETKTIKFYGDATFDVNAVRMTKDNKKLVTLVNRDSSISPAVYDTDTGEMEKIDFPPGIAMGGDLRDDRYLVLMLNMPTSPSSIAMYDLVEKKTEIVLKPEIEGVDSSLFVDAEHIWYPSLDGTQIPALLYKPRDFDPSKKYPALVSPHGGPTAQYVLYFDMFSQYLTDLGYIVLLPNVRGSTGYGVEFRDACLMDWGGKDHEDWVAGRQYLIDHVSADPEKIAVFGGSYGGYATLVCMTKSPELWKAGIAWIPVSSLKNAYKHFMEHFKYFLRTQMGDPEENKELWEERSPINYVKNILNPLMLVHGKNDPRCHVSESRNVVTKLEELGRKQGPDGEFEYVEFEEEGHGGTQDIEFRIRTFELLTDFLERRL